MVDPPLDNIHTLKDLLSSFSTPADRCIARRTAQTRAKSVECCNSIEGHKAEQTYRTECRNVVVFA